MTKYVIKQGSRTSTPSLAKFCVKAETIRARFKLGESFSYLYDLVDNSTHKIIGFSDYFGWNSVRLGLRRKPTNNFVDEFVPVAYLHENGVTRYPKIEGITLKVGKTYEVTIYKNMLGYYDIKLDELDEYNYVVKTAQYLTSVKFGSGCKRLQGIYVEVGSKASYWNLDLEMEHFLI